MPPDEQMDRRRFFRFGLRSLIKPLAQVVDTAVEVANQMAKIEPADAPRSPLPPEERQQPTIRPPDGETASRGRSRSGAARSLLPPLRPPGALVESLMLETCQRSGECVRACPARCIKLDPDIAGGLPRIEVDAMPCLVCTGLHCMQVCPTGALVPTPLADINMGTAVWNESICLRTKGLECTICVDDCPLGEVAIVLRDGQIQVSEHGCIGCGVCQNHCPTTPKSIVVVPKRPVA
jgi:ferredoxin-type protein NapG